MRQQAEVELRERECGTKTPHGCKEPGTVLTSLLELHAALLEWSQSVLTTQAIGRSDYVLTVENL
jgi:hypothetical protein